jgi:hypothetical protein
MDAYRHPVSMRFPPLPPIAKPVQPVEEKICPLGKVLNPASDRCVKEDGEVGAKQQEQVAAPDCPPGKIRNPKTRRCVKVDGWAGKRALAQMRIPENLYEPLEAQKPDCPPGKIRNPKTRRCVKVDGWAGKRVQQAFPPLPKSESANKPNSDKGLLKGTRKFLKGLFKGRTRKN